MKATLRALCLCAGAFVTLTVPGASASPPSDRSIGAHAAIQWSACGVRLQCSTVRVPLSWARPSGHKIRLAVIRHRASRPGKRRHSLFFNPGGPGVSGVKDVRDKGAELDAVAGGRFDIVSWDPRGVGASTHVRCSRGERRLRRFWGPLLVPTSEAQSRRYSRKTSVYARRCAKRSGRLLRHISTADTARDLDRLRRLLGERRLTYLGWSYGTFIGQTYTNLFPHRVRAMVLDGLVDPVATVTGIEARVANNLASVDRGLRGFESSCRRAGPVRCALAGHGRPVGERVTRLLDRARRHPIPAPSSPAPHRLSYGDLLTSLYAPLNSPAAWPQLATDLDRAARGDVSALEKRAREAGRSLRAALVPSQAINCADSPARKDLDDWHREIKRFTRISRIRGPLLGWWLWAACASWREQSADRYTGPWNASTKNPILLVGTTGDPATAFANARRAARQLGNAVLLTHRGYGHVSISDASTCVERATRRYLVQLVAPRRGRVCPSDHRPFDPHFGE